MALSAAARLLLVNSVDTALVLLQVRLIHLLADQLHSRVVIAHHEEAWLQVVSRQRILFPIFLLLFAGIELLAIPEID